MNFRQFVVRGLLLLTIVVCALLLASPSFAAPPTASLKLYFIDVEGGQATLIVAPGNKSMLVDTGFPGYGGRDADRIVKATKLAGIDHLDYVLITHYHIDHVGGIFELAKRIKIGAFLDHGPNREAEPRTIADYEAYQKLWPGHEHHVLKPGDRFELGDASISIVASAGDAITTPLSGAGEENPLCASEPAPADDPSENAQSVGFVLTYGKFHFVDLGDLTKKKELALACPRNLIGHADLYLTTHHGLDQSNSRALVQALRPRVAIMNNGAHKGGIPASWQIVHDSPGLEDLWQLHYAADTDAGHNTKEPMIANTSENCAGQYLTVSATSDGRFTVTNSRNGYSQSYH
jgi:beta-lactamase superfamily II metal-dependent hydrolase